MKRICCCDRNMENSCWIIRHHYVYTLKNVIFCPFIAVIAIYSKEVAHFSSKLNYLLQSRETKKTRNSLVYLLYELICSPNRKRTYCLMWLGVVLLLFQISGSQDEFMYWLGLQIEMCFCHLGAWFNILSMPVQTFSCVARTHENCYLT